jgi:hypothetical protein
MRDGAVLARFAHRRLREKPPSGGVSVLCESIEPPVDALDAATRLLAGVRWNGVAMVEYKIDEREGVARILEVNARFWGSLELAVSAGVDFPYLLFRMATGERIGESTGYRVGLKVRWELGDLDHLWIRLFRNLPAVPTGDLLPSVLRISLPTCFAARGTRSSSSRRKTLPHELGRRSVRRLRIRGAIQKGSIRHRPSAGPQEDRNKSLLAGVWQLSDPTPGPTFPESAPFRLQGKHLPEPLRRGDGARAHSR